MTTIAKQTTFRHKLAYYAELSYLQYENLRHQYFLEWCGKIAHQKYIPLEWLSKNDYLKNWFDDQWVALVEGGIKKCYDDGLDRKVFTPDDVLLMLDIFCTEIQNYYPKVLLDKIIKDQKYENKIRQ